MDNGWVKLHRQLFSNEMWLSEPFTKAQAWIDLFANANHEDGSFWVRGNEVKIQRGQIGWSELTMVKRWRWSKNKVRRFLKWLETEQQIVQQKYLYITTIITIINYDKYQQTEQQTIQQKDSRRYINKNVKNVKNKEETPEASASLWNFEEELKKLQEGKRKDYQIIAFYFLRKNWKFENKDQFTAALVRELRPAKALKGYSGPQIEQSMDYCKSNYEVWTLETCSKRIQDLVNTK